MTTYLITGANRGIGLSPASRLQERGDRVIGLVATQLTQMTGITTSESADGIIAHIGESTITTAGEFWHANGERHPW